MSDSWVTISVNGEVRSVRSGTTVSELIEEIGLESSRIAIEFNREILIRGVWPTTELGDGTSVEIVHFVGGG